jgi:hypothetical protein
LYTTALLRLPKKPYTLADFEPGSSVPEADAMSSAPRRQCVRRYLCFDAATVGFLIHFFVTFLFLLFAKSCRDSQSLTFISSLKKDGIHHDQSSASLIFISMIEEGWNSPRPMFNISSLEERWNSPQLCSTSLTYFLDRRKMEFTTAMFNHHPTFLALACM